MSTRRCVWSIGLTATVVLLAACRSGGADPAAPGPAPPGAVSASPTAPNVAASPAAPTVAEPTVPESTVAVAAPGAFDAVVERVGKDLAVGPHGGLAPADVGYYVDVQQARLLQLADAGLTTTREDTRLVVTLTGAPSFDSGSSTLTGDAIGALDALVPVLSDYRQTVVSIHGHTDATGNEAANRALAERRAMVVADYLMSRGIERARLVVVGHGSSRPVAPNDTEAGRLMNRRVEVHLDPVRR